MRPLLVAFLSVLLGLPLAAETAAPPPAASTPLPPGLEGTWTGTIRRGAESGAFGLQIFRAKDGVRVGARLWMPLLNAYGSFIGEVKAGEGQLGIPDFGTPLAFDGESLTGHLYLPDLKFSLRRGGELPAEELPPADLPQGPEPAWTYVAGAPLWTTPTVVGTVAYVGDGAGKLHAVDVATGRALWVKDTGAAIHGDVTADGAFLYVANDSGHLLKLARADGAEIWRADLGGAGIRALPSFGGDWDFAHAAAIVADDTVYVGSATGVFHALDAGTGKARWTFATGGKIRAAACLAGDRIAFGSMDRFVYTLDRANGTLIWKFDTGGPVTTRPVLADDKLVIGTRDAALLYALNVRDGTVAWSDFWWLSWIESAPVLADDGLLYIGSSDSRRIRCLEPATGRVRWTAQVWGWSWGTPLVRGDTVYFGTAGAAQYFVSQRASLGALDRATGKLKWRTPLPLLEHAYTAGIAGSLVSAGPFVLAAGLDGTLRALPAP
jgi:outer membrane protein assembly factor BamB